MSSPWQPPVPPPLPPQRSQQPFPATRSRWLPAAIVGSAIVIAAGLVAGALILRGDGDGSTDTAATTCQAWTETRETLRSIPALPEGWNWNTPNIDTYIKNQNAPVGKALDLFEPKIAPTPADVARAAQDYVTARRTQMQSLADRSYRPADGTAVDVALGTLNRLCGIRDTGTRI